MTELDRVRANQETPQSAIRNALQVLMVPHASAPGTDFAVIMDIADLNAVTARLEQALTMLEAT